MKLPPKYNLSLIVECALVVLYLWLGPRLRWVDSVESKRKTKRSVANHVSNMAAHFPSGIT